MTNLISEAGPVFAIVVLGVIGFIALIGVSVVRYRAIARAANKLVELALGGRADQARIYARNATQDLNPLLDALGGQLSRPRHRSLFRDLLMLLALPIPTVLLAIYGLSRIRGTADHKVGATAALMYGLAVLVPLSFAAAFGLIGIGRHARRLVRGSCVTLLARNVRAAVDTDVAEALRRGPATRDPRCE